MKLSKKILSGIFTCCLATSAIAQEAASEALTYRAEAFGSAATGEYTPFWMANNQYGIVPLQAGNGYFRGSLFNNQSLWKDFHWGAGLDVIAAAPRYRNVYIQQLYAELGYQKLLLTIGSKERYITSLWDRALSSGDMIYSANARPIPEINISLPAFTIVPLTKGWLQLKGDFAVGRSFDTDYLADLSVREYYTEKVLWHHKSIFVQIKDTRNQAPLSVAFGIQHIAQWGGTSTNPAIGDQPQSFKDFVKVVLGQSGGEDATVSDQINVLGNHHISYDMKLSYSRENWAAHGYYQHLSSDKSGLLFYNMTDGLWGGQIDLPRFPWLKKLVVEYIVTRNQSGPMHYLYFNHDIHKGRGGGADNYYNNGEYTTGNSYFNRSTGSPLLPSPEYNADGSLGFQSTRVRDWHLGIEGNLSSQASYRLLLTTMNGWGTPYRPFLEQKTGASFLIDIAYTHPRLSGWLFTGSVAADTGDITDSNGIGFGLKISKRGLLKAWQ